MKFRMMTLTIVLLFVFAPHMALASENNGQTTVPSDDVQWQAFLDYDDRHPASLESLFTFEVQRLSELAERPLESQPESSPAEVAEEKTEPQRSKKESSSAVQEKPKPASSANNTPDQNRALAKSMVYERGWSKAQWQCLDAMWQRESGWKHKAQNPSSTAYGIAQFLNSTWQNVGMNKTSDPRLQIEAGLRYIKQRYDTPCGAWNFWQRNHWY